MRLIDADILIEFIDMGKYCNPYSLAFSENDVVEMIEGQPTAYDVDKVCDEINRYSIDNTDWSYSSNPELASYYLMRTKDAIDIVRRGGVDD